MARTTVADVLADGLARAGAGRLFAARASDPAAIALRAAAVRRGVPVHEAPDADGGGCAGRGERRGRRRAGRPASRVSMMRPASFAVSPTPSVIARR